MDGPRQFSVISPLPRARAMEDPARDRNSSSRRARSGQVRRAPRILRSSGASGDCSARWKGIARSNRDQRRTCELEPRCHRQ